MLLPRFLAAFLVAALTLLAAAPAVNAHSSHEALELEQHILNDEGTDTMEAYGGYDINDLFLGAAHHAELGAGPAGDGLYFRIELYGTMGDTASSQPWTITVSFTGPQGPISRTLTTTDGTTFTSDFDALEYSVDADAHEVRIERAFLLNQKAGLAVGDKLTDLQVTTHYGADLRDVAPGDLYVPNTGGRLTFQDPLAIAGEGVLQSDPRVPDVADYFGAIRATAGATYTLNVTSGLRQGAQHILLGAAPTPGWTFQLESGGGEVPGNGSTTFRFSASQEDATQPLQLLLTTDVGGRLDAQVDVDGTLRVAGTTASPDTSPSRSTPAALLSPLLGLLAIASAHARRRP